MRLCIATPLYPPEIGGPATYTRLLEDGLPAKGVEVEIVKFSTVRRYPTGIRHVVYLAHLLKRARTCDLVLALDPVSVGLPTLLASRLLRKPYIVKIVGDYAWEQGRQRFGTTEPLDSFVRNRAHPLPVRILTALQRRVASGAVRVIVPSEYLKTIVEAWGIPGDRITVIYNAVELPPAADVSSTITSLTTPRIVSVGRLVPWKGVDTLIEAVAQLRSVIPGASLIIAGDGPERAHLEAQASQVLRDGYVFAGQLTHAEVSGLLASADIVVLNSSYEGLSHMLIEALMARKAIIATRAGGNTELITHEHNGLLVEVGDTEGLARAMERVATDPGLAARLAQNARSAKETFDTGRMIQTTYNALSRYV